MVTKKKNNSTNTYKKKKFTREKGTDNMENERLAPDNIE